MADRKLVTITATGAQTAFTQMVSDNVMTVQISGTYATLAFKFQGSADNGSTYCDIACIDLGSMQVTAGGTTISPTDNTTRIFRIPSENLTNVRMNVSTLASGSVSATGQSGKFSGGVFSNAIVNNQTLTGDSTITGTQTITSTSASALTVGANGATNPVVKINANTASVATGVQITGAAEAGGVAIAAISSGTDETLKIDAKGAGVVAIGDTSTSPAYLNRGALKALQVGLTLTALGTTQSSTPTAAQLLGGFLTQTGSTGAGAITLPTGTALSAACPRTPATGDSFECIIANLGGGQTLTVTGATGTTVVSGGAIATAKTAIAKFICTGSNSWSIAVIGG